MPCYGVKMSLIRSTDGINRIGSSQADDGENVEI